MPVPVLGQWPGQLLLLLQRLQLCLMVVVPVSVFTQGGRVAEGLVCDQSAEGPSCHF